MKELLYIFIGGGTGSCLRYSISALWQHMRLNPAYSGIIFPWPTFTANILGCLFIGYLYTRFEAWGTKPDMALLLTTGFCGGFTTFSTFSWESMNLLRTGNYGILCLYIFLSVTLGISAAFLPTILK